MSRWRQGSWMVVVVVALLSSGCRGVPIRDDRPTAGLTPTSFTPPEPAGAPQVRRRGLLSRLRDRGAEIEPSLATSGTGMLGASQLNAPMPDLTPARACGLHLDFGRVHLSQGRYAEAATAFRQALEACPARGEEADKLRALAHRKLAAALDAQGKLDEATSHYEEALQLAPNDARVWNDAGYASYLRRDWQTAELRLRQAAKLAPDDPRIATNLGLTLAAAGKADEAFDSLSRASGPAAADANLGYILAATGQEPAARQRYEAALGRRPDLEVARSALALLDNAPPIPTTLPPDLMIATVDRSIEQASFHGVPLPPLPTGHGEASPPNRDP